MGSRGDHLWEISMSFKDSHIVILNLNCFISFSRPPWLNFICNLMLEENFIFIHLYLLKAVSRLSFSHFVNNANNERTNHSFASKEYFSPEIISNISNNKKELWKTIRLRIFKTTGAIRFNQSFEVVQPCLLLYLLLFITSFKVLSAVIFMFHSIWWQFPLFELW